MAVPTLPHAQPGSYLVGLVGAGIGTSLSPALHEHEARCLGLAYAYRVLDLDELEVAPHDVGDLLDQARDAGFDGLNVTHPCKQLVLEHLDALTDEAAALGAVNTVVLRDGRAVGDNTDGTGFAESFRRGLPGAALDRALLIGAGGAGAAVAHALLGLGCGRLDVLDTDRDRAAQLVEALAGRFGTGRASVAEELERALPCVDGVVNATPTGMVGHGGTPVPAQLLRPELWVADVVYRPLETELLRDARAAGCRTLDGGGMVVLQAAGSFERFTGAKPDRERMLRHFATLGGR
jgi:shikimate dehydrogenase